MSEAALEQDIISVIDENIRANYSYLKARIVTTLIMIIICIFKLLFPENVKDFSANTLLQNYFLFFVPLAVEYKYGLTPLTKGGEIVGKIGQVISIIFSVVSLVGLLGGIPNIILESDIFYAIVIVAPIAIWICVIFDWLMSLNLKDKKYLIAKEILQEILLSNDINQIKRIDIKNKVDQKLLSYINKGKKEE